MIKQLMTHRNRIIAICVWMLCIGTIISLMGFANHQMDIRTCKQINIHLINEEEVEFLTVDDIQTMLHEKQSRLMQIPMKDINVHDIEQMLNCNPYIAKTEVYKSIDGKLNIDITPRIPIARIINRKGESFYIDSKGFLMPWSNAYTAPLPVFTGNIYECYDVCYRFDYSRKEINDSVLIKNNMYGIYALAKKLYSSEFWHAQIEQVNIGVEVEMIPLVGAQRIVLGDFTNIDEKLDNLFVFYKQGLNKVGWNIYESINLSYKHQIVCKRYSEPLNY